MTYDADIHWTSYALGWLSLLLEPGPILLYRLWRNFRALIER